MMRPADCGGDSSYHVRAGFGILLPMPPADAHHRSRTAILTAAAMVAFASNSILCRLALQSRAIDPASFTLFRVVAGAVVLTVLTRASRARPAGPTRAGWTSAGALFAYAIAFSLAYVELSAGTGALILFGCVQATMLIAALRGGERPRALEWIGLALAIAGLVYLTSPGLAAPSALGSALMASAGVAWGVYSLRGRTSTQPAGDTRHNFVRAVPMALVAGIAVPIGTHSFRVSREGALLATASGAISSGLGYAVWYAALRGLTATRAAIVQLSVPVIAAVGGIVFLSERVVPRVVISGVVILGGVALALAGRRSRGR